MHRDRERLLNREIDPVADFCIGRSWFLGDFIWVLFYGCVERPLEFSLDVRVNFQRAHFPRSQRCLYPFSFFLIVFVLILLLLLFSYNRHRGIGGNRGLAPDSDCGIFVYADIDDSRGFLRLRSIFRRFFFLCLRDYASTPVDWFVSVHGICDSMWWWFLLGTLIFRVSLLLLLLLCLVLWRIALGLRGPIDGPS